MWVDLAAWDDARRAGIPSGAWGIGDGQMKKMAPKIGAAEVKKRSAAAAAEARERKMGALVAAGITGTNRKTSKTRTPPGIEPATKEGRIRDCSRRRLRCPTRSWCETRCATCASPAPRCGRSWTRP